MKYAFVLPTTALFALGLISSLVHFDVIPAGITILEDLKSYFGEYFYALIFFIILAESIVYVGFYFPGQFFAVVLVILSKPTVADILFLTFAMVAAATMGSYINYRLGQLSRNDDSQHSKISLKALLLAMIHINSLAFFMFNQGSKNGPLRVIWMAGLLNLPYYLLLITSTALLSEEIMQVAESTWLMISIVCVWLIIAIVLDVRNARSTQQKT
ncbi:hypothetical protein Q4574_09170 [Aliiglaciecola sp. 3_MG-2023]|uniref:hypothetical protein n=1 Tax=Aliiglaciecola sp. 3_MG-2023 TaxID=3062644 RepID=UPI0026E1E246|nr:hypothetical protein [Aliiglaciecola sp. 3_MG-2023]MDO6693455.1 hypothetical protein [Aliiglaciecola sp. 3_MG-2023]